MTIVHSQLIRLLSGGLLLTIGIALVANADGNDQSAKTFARQPTFRLTFANRDLIWLGDPASPSATMYIQPAARPIATDFYVRTRVESQEPLGRRYMREARIAAGDGVRNVYAFTEQREKAIGTIDDHGRFSPNDFYAKHRELLPSWPADASVLVYDSKENALYYEVEIPGPTVTESLDFLPLNLCDDKGAAVTGRFSIDYAHSPNSDHATKFAVVSLTLRGAERSISVANAVVPSVFRRGDVQLGSFDNNAGTYVPEAAYRPGATLDKKSEPSVTVEFPAKFTSAVQSDAKSLVVTAPWSSDPPADANIRIQVDGSFDDWGNVAGVDDVRGDVVPYLEYVPDVDLLEFKVAHDDEHIYLYARVAGQVGRSHPHGGRSYFYAYMDVDQNPGTGFLPTRDDDCYFGVDIGDDCEVQFEFVNNALLKSFYGFCGLGGNDNVLKQMVTLGKSQYGRFDGNGVERANYKAEYIYRDGVIEITEDLKPGTSDTIRVALSPDGSEVEVASTFTGFLKGPDGRPTVALGQTIDLAVGMECDSKAYPGKTRWGADSTIAIRDYRLVPAASRNDSTR